MILDHRNHSEPGPSGLKFPLRFRTHKIMSMFVITKRLGNERRKRTLPEGGWWFQTFIIIYLHVYNFLYKKH